MQIKKHYRLLQTQQDLAPTIYSGQVEVGNDYLYQICTVKGAGELIIQIVGENSVHIFPSSGGHEGFVLEPNDTLEIKSGDLSKWFAQSEGGTSKIHSIGSIHVGSIVNAPISLDVAYIVSTGFTSELVNWDSEEFTFDME